VLDDASITQWLQSLQAGDRAAAQKLWNRYFQQLVRLASGKLPGHARREFDEEDVALSAFRSFLSGVQENRFPRLEDRHDLRSLLVVITRRKAQAYLRRQTRQKRGGGQVLGESGVAPLSADAGAVGLDALIGEEPTPAFAVQAAEECQRLLDCLGDETLRSIAVQKMQGYTVEEIATQTNSTKRTVERRLQIIRKKWTAVAAEEDAP
jgi:RNA polymerase sigma factor (sigma-70 family)